jgi:hypothetical protein
LLNGDLWLSMMWQSRKAADLQVDDRVLVHSIVTRPDGDEGEIKIRGRVVPVDDPELRLHYCDAIQSLGWRPVEPYFHLFVVDIADVPPSATPRVATSTSLDGQRASSSYAMRPRLPVSANRNPSPICSGRSSHCPAQRRDRAADLGVRSVPLNPRRLPPDQAVQLGVSGESLWPAGREHEALDEVGNGLFAAPRRIRPFVDSVPPVLTRGPNVPGQQMHMEVRDLIADDRGIDMFDWEHRHQAAGQVGRRHTHAASLSVGEIGEPSCVPSGLDEEMTQIHLRDRVSLRRRQNSVGSDDKLVFPYESARHGQVTPMLRTHEAGLLLHPQLPEP